MKKIICIVLALVTAISVLLFGGCKRAVDNSEKTIEIFAYKAGYGVEWLNAMKKVFEERTDYKIEIREQNSSDVLESMVKAGPSTTVDLFIVGEVWDRYIELGSKAVKGYEYCLEPLDEVYNYTPAGESKTIGDKMWDDYNDFYKMTVTENGERTEHYYAMPWASGLTGLMYNTSLFEQAGLTHEPRTTDELAEYCATLQSNGILPFMYSAQAGYWEYMFFQWWAQYQTIKGYDNFYNCKIADNAIPDPVTSMGIFEQQGIYQSMKTIEELLDPSKNYTYTLAEDAAYGDAQAYFLRGNKEDGAMMPAADWIENEMKTMEGGGLEIGDIMPMRTPILSAISDKLSYWKEDASYSEAQLSEQKRAEYDANLRALIDYADGVTAQLPAYGSEDDVKKDAAIVKEARELRYSIGMTHSCAIPVYATAKEGAKEFLKFIASDEGLKLYLENTNGANLPYDFDIEGWEGYAGLSDFAKKKYDMYEGAQWLPVAAKYQSAYLGGLEPVYKTSTFEVALGSRDAQTRKSTDALKQSTIDHYRPIMKNVLDYAGLI